MNEKVKPIYSDQRVKKHQNWLIIIAVLIVITIVGSWTIIQKVQNAGRPSKEQYPVLGMMIDQNDGYLDFQTLKKHDIQFIYLKATQGASYTDDDLENNYSRIKGSQIPFGFYHTVSFDSTSKNQFKNITENLVMEKGTLPFVLKVSAYGDYESSGIPKLKSKKIVKELRTDIANYYGDDCIIQVDDSSKFLAKYFNRVWYVSDKTPTDPWTIWQYSADAHIPGFASSNRYHLSVLNGGKNVLDGLIQSQ